METLKNLAEAAGLNSSFFWQFFLFAGAYFAAKALFLEPYARARDKRKSLTQGRFSQSREREKEIERLKTQCEEQARALHKKFQNLFGRVKSAAEAEYKEERARLLKKREADFEERKASLAKKIQEERRALEKDIPSLAKDFVQALREKVN